MSTLTERRTDAITAPARGECKLAQTQASIKIRLAAMHAEAEVNIAKLPASYAQDRTAELQASLTAKEDAFPTHGLQLLETSV